MNNLGSKGKALTDEIAAILDDMVDEEARLLREHQAATERTSTFIQISVAIALITAIVFGLLNAIQMARHRDEIQTAYDTLRITYERLLAEEREQELTEPPLRQVP